jgi:hypothetical protein
VIVYNKGGQLQILSHINVDHLPNIGREGHTYLHHIIENYNNLADVNVFLQGRIDDLIYPVFNPLDHYIDDAIEFGFSASHFHIVGPDYWCQPPFRLEGNGPHAQQLRSGKMLGTTESMLEFFYRKIGRVPLYCVVTYCGCFSATRESIHARPINFYKSLIEEVSYHSNPLCGHYLERMWAYIFGGQRILARALKINKNLINFYDTCN